MGAPTMSGALHPRMHSQLRDIILAGLTNNLPVVNKVRHEFRQIFFEMGFEEMPTNRYGSLVTRDLPC